jgi:pimeloyl-ACP methyl ester carboxylesterase
MTRPFPRVAGVEHRYVEARGLRVHLAEAGDGPPLVLLHGWPQHWYAWRRLIPELSARYRVICPDLRGHGWTGAPPGTYEKEELASDLLAVLDALGLPRVRLAGHDWGAFAGFLACLREPERFERFLASGAPPPWARSRPSPAVLARLVYQPLVAMPVLGPALVQRTPFIGTLIRAGTATSGTWTGEEVRAFTDAWREPERARATSALYRTFLTRELPAIARGRYARARLRVPTLLLYGDRDPVVTGPSLEGADRQADDMRIEAVPAGHFMLEEAPAEVLARMLPFLES